jgi:hypothetical protein
MARFAPAAQKVCVGEIVPHFRDRREPAHQLFYAADPSARARPVSVHAGFVIMPDRHNRKMSDAHVLPYHEEDFAGCHQWYVAKSTAYPLIIEWE